MPRTVHRQCTLCEAHCGIDVEVMALLVRVGGPIHPSDQPAARPV